MLQRRLRLRMTAPVGDQIGARNDPHGRELARRQRRNKQWRARLRSRCYSLASHPPLGSPDCEGAGERAFGRGQGFHQLQPRQRGAFRARVGAFEHVASQRAWTRSSTSYHVRPPHGWPHWCEEQLRPEISRFVLVICTATYLARVRATRFRPTRGAASIGKARSFTTTSTRKGQHAVHSDPVGR